MNLTNAQLFDFRPGRFGLFTAYAPLAIGDNSMYAQKKRK